jgi:uridylate kinase
MTTQDSSPIVISIGGSLIVPEKIDVELLKRLDSFIRKYVQMGRRFFLTTGGGKTCRYYQEAADSVNEIMDAEDLDWLGIHATRLNGQLLRTIFVDIAHPRMIENYEHKLENWTQPVVIGAGWNPGHSTDYCGVMLAKDYGSRLLIKMTGVGQVYDKNPKTDPTAKPIKQISWSDYQKLVGDSWTPGLNTPFDPIAAKLSKKLALKVVIANGTDFSNLEDIIEGRDFDGTTIGPE